MLGLSTDGRSSRSAASKAVTRRGASAAVRTPARSTGSHQATSDLSYGAACALLGLSLIHI
eukprot:2278904-Alexandrium_andersonii.AAC.1